MLLEQQVVLHHTLGNEEDIVGWSIFPGKVLLQNAPLVYLVILKSCDKIRNVRNSIIVCRGEYAHLESQARYVARSNVLGAIIILDNPITIAMEDRNYFLCPCILISLDNARVLKQYIKSTDQPVANLTFQQAMMGIKLAPVVASYAHRGPSPHTPCILKPDIMAPGSLILGKVFRSGPFIEPQK